METNLAHQTAGSKPQTHAGIARKAVRGAAAIGIRQVLMQGFNVVGGIILARLLSPSEFGFYAIVIFLTAFLVAFGDAGLAASLVRQSEEPTEHDYRAVFTGQQALVGIVVLAFWLASPWIAGAYHLPPRGAWLFRLVALSLLFTSFQVIPTVRLERHLAFDKIAAVEVTMSFVFNTTAVSLAYLGFGAYSFVLALVARSAIGAILANLVSPWPIGWSLDWQRVQRHLRFGIPYQGISMISLVKDSVTPVFVGLLLGAKQVGYLNWSQMVAAYPFLALMVFQRVYLPSFARMQSDPAALGRFVERVLWATNGVASIVAVLLLALIQPLTRIVYGEKWLVALPLFYVVWGVNFFAPTATPLTALLNALGDSRTTFLMSLAWMVGTWALGVPLIMKFGPIGIPIASLAVTFTAPLLFWAAKRRVPFRILPVIAKSWVGALGVGLALFFSQALWPIRTIYGLGVYALSGLLMFAVVMAVWHPQEMSRLRGWIMNVWGSKIAGGVEHAD